MTGNIITAHSHTRSCQCRHSFCADSGVHIGRHSRGPSCLQHLKSASEGLHDMQGGLPPVCMFPCIHHISRHWATLAALSPSRHYRRHQQWRGAMLHMPHDARQSKQCSQMELPPKPGLPCRVRWYLTTMSSCATSLHKQMPWPRARLLWSCVLRTYPTTSSPTKPSLATGPRSASCCLS